MKKILFKLTAAVAAFFVIFLSASVFSEITASAKGKTGLTYLVIGLDDAAQNADIIMLVGCVPEENRLSFLQIPRDTYYNYGGGQNKINGVFSSYRNSGMSNNESLRRFSADVEDTFGVDIDASFAITMTGFRNFVSSLGGVSVDMPYEYTFTDEHGDGGFTLPAGENLLSADKAETFIRYRRGYALGDLSRINAQKIFLKGMVKTVLKKRFADTMAAMLAIRNNLYTDCEITDILKLLMKKQGRNKEIAYKFVTLPGEAVIGDNGGSYFCANKKNSQEVLNRYFSSCEFDKKQILLNSANRVFHNAYYDENGSYSEYDGNSFDTIKLR